MIRSIPNPPMDREDVARFRRDLEKHLRGDFSVEKLGIKWKCMKMSAFSCYVF